MNKKIIWSVVAVVVLVIAFYALSPLWNVKVSDESSPLSSTSNSEKMESVDSMDSMSVEEKAKFEAAVMEVKDKVMEKNITTPAKAELVAKADFKASAHDVKGQALLIKESNGKYVLRFENFETINGPDLRIYMSTGLDDKDFIDLGEIKATKGNVNYSIPEGTDLSKYKNVLVWCEDFSILFSYASF